VLPSGEITVKETARDPTRHRTPAHASPPVNSPTRAKRGRIVSREELYRLAWGGTLRPGDRSVDVYVHKLRTKLEQALPHATFIHTHLGFGYRFELHKL
jgi:hypothetical protein